MPSRNGSSTTYVVSLPPKKTSFHQIEMYPNVSNMKRSQMGCENISLRCVLYAVCRIGEHNLGDVRFVVGMYVVNWYVLLFQEKSIELVLGWPFHFPSRSISGALSATSETHATITPGSRGAKTNNNSAGKMWRASVRRDSVD